MVFCFVFSKKATKIEEIFTVDLSIFVAFLENINFTKIVPTF